MQPIKRMGINVFLPLSSPLSRSRENILVIILQGLTLLLSGNRSKFYLTS